MVKNRHDCFSCPNQHEMGCTQTRGVLCVIHPDAPCIYVLYFPTKEFDNARCTGAVQQHDQCWCSICLVEFAIVIFNGDTRNQQPKATGCLGRTLNLEGI